jgi:hypothetical protein
VALGKMKMSEPYLACSGGIVCPAGYGREQENLPAPNSGSGKGEIWAGKQTP